VPVYSLLFFVKSLNIKRLKVLVISFEFNYSAINYSANKRFDLNLIIFILIVLPQNRTAKKLIVLLLI